MGKSQNPVWLFSPDNLQNVSKNAVFIYMFIGGDNCSQMNPLPLRRFLSFLRDQSFFSWCTVFLPFTINGDFLGWSSIVVMPWASLGCSYDVIMRKCNGHLYIVVLIFPSKLFIDTLILIECVIKLSKTTAAPITIQVFHSEFLLDALFSNCI